MNLRSETQAVLLLVAVIVLWGVNWPVMKVGLQYIPPLWFAAARVLLGCAFLFALLAVTRQVRWPLRADLPVLISVGGLQIAAFLGFAHAGIQYLEAGRSAILAYTTPLWVTPLAVALLGERLTALRAGGLGLGLGGLAVLFNPAAFEVTRAAVLGNSLVLIGAMAWAITIVHVRAHRWRMTPLQLIPWQMLLGGIGLTILAAVVEGPLWGDGAVPVQWSTPLWVVLAYNGPVASAFCFWAFVVVNRALPATTTALGSLGVPVVGVVTSALVLGEPLTATKVSGLALICAGVGLVTVADVRRGRDAEAEAKADGGRP